jgi:hypothetical protein
MRSDALAFVFRGDTGNFDELAGSFFRGETKP